MITLKLQVIHRLLLLGLIELASKKGQSLSDLNQSLKIIDKVNLTEDERKSLSYRTEEVGKDKDGNPTFALKWDTKDKKTKKDIDIEKDFELSNDQQTLVIKMIEDKSAAKEFTAENLPLIKVAEQLGIKV